MTKFDQVFETLPGNGWLTKEEAQLLYLYAEKATGPILEVGCFEGRSTCLLASFGRPVYAVDPFVGFHSDDPSGDRTCRAWRSNMTERNIGLFELTPGAMFPARVYENSVGSVELYRQKVEDWTPRSVGFAYLDGDHTYRGTISQIEKALACGAKTIAVHDVNDSGDGKEIKRACLERLGPWAVRIQRLAIWEDVK